jgi:hypothetical protein
MAEPPLCQECANWVRTVDLFALRSRHSAQGVTADTSHAVLGENATRSLLYVAMTVDCIDAMLS